MPQTHYAKVLHFCFKTFSSVPFFLTGEKKVSCYSFHQIYLFAIVLWYYPAFLLDMLTMTSWGQGLFDLKIYCFSSMSSYLLVRYYLTGSRHIPFLQEEEDIRTIHKDFQFCTCIPRLIAWNTNKCYKNVHYYLVSPYAPMCDFTVN